MESSRRELIKTTTLALGGLVVGFYVPEKGSSPAWAQGAVPKAPPAPNAFIRIASDESITIFINKLEMGQGVNTSMAQLIAEELECDWQKIQSVSAPVDPVYNHTMMGIQMTGGSTSLASSWEQHRLLGANMREMLRQAAAEVWKVPLDSCQAQKGTIVHTQKGQLTYGQLAEAASRMPLPTRESITLKAAAAYQVIGQSKARVDAADKVNGKAIFGLDVKLPGMLHAIVLHPPFAGAHIKSVDDKKAKATAGVIDVVRMKDRVAVLAKNTFAAIKGRDALAVTWDKKGTDASSSSFLAAFQKAAKGDAPIAETRGLGEKPLLKAKRTIEAEYVLPFLAHAAMEPLNVTINFDGKTCEMWSGHQMPGIDTMRAAQILGIDPSAVTAHTTYVGGSFGRRASKDCDYVAVAAELAKLVKKPLKVTWTREDDMRGGYYRPMALHRVRVGLKDKNLLAWDHRVVCQSIMKGTPFEAMMIKGGIEEAAVEGIAHTPYAFENFRCTQNLVDTPMTTLWWRSVGNTHTAYVMETMIDELAHAFEQDPFVLRRQLLAASPRHLAVLDLLEERSGWKTRDKSGPHAFGVALHQSFGSVVGHVVMVSIVDKMPRVHKVWSAVHCGQVVNPEQAKTQVEGSIVFGLSAALYQEIAVEKGRVQTGNFDTYPVMRIDEMPVVDVAFVASTDAPSGLGEPAVPPIAPAVANAYFALSKKRLRTLPFSKSIQV